MASSLNFIDRTTLDLADGPNVLSGRLIDPETTYVYTFAPWVGRFTGAGKQIHGREFVRLSDVLANSGSFTFVDRRTLDLADGLSPLTGNAVSPETTYVYTFIPRAGVISPSGNQAYGRDFIKLSDVLTTQESFNFIDRTIPDLGDGTNGFPGRTVNPATTYVYTFAAYSGRFTPSGKQIHGREFVRLSDVLSAINSASQA